MAIGIDRRYKNLMEPQLLADINIVFSPDSPLLCLVIKQHVVNRTIIGNKSVNPDVIYNAIQGVPQVRYLLLEELIELLPAVFV